MFVVAEITITSPFLGMPHKYYHGRTGRVFNVTNRSLGVVVSKPVRNRIEKKKICIRAEHVSDNII